MIRNNVIHTHNGGMGEEYQKHFWACCIKQYLFKQKQSMGSVYVHFTQFKLHFDHKMCNELPQRILPLS